MLLSGEQVVIVWDPATKTQHFVRQATFTTKAKDFGFIVPTPSKPELSVADTAVFASLAAYVERKKAEQKAWKLGEAKATQGVTGSIEILDTKQVGDYLATVVKASDASALNAWLKRNGFVSRPAMEQWLDHYIRQEWVFTALKYNGGEATETKTQAVRLSFKTDKPHYPFKMPSDTWPPGWKRPLTVYFVSTGRAESRYVARDASWEAQVDWAGPMTSSVATRLAGQLNLHKSAIPRDATLTVFVNKANRNGFDSDLVFETRSASMVPLGVAGVAVGGLLALAAARRRGRRRAL